MLIMLIGVTAVFAVLWIFIIVEMPEGMQRFMARHQYLFLLFHIPVMWLLGTILGEGMVSGVSSLAGGLIGQAYLGVRGMRKWGLTFIGRKTPDYEAIIAEEKAEKAEQKGLSKAKKMRLAADKKLLAYLEWRDDVTPNHR